MRNKKLISRLHNPNDPNSGYRELLLAVLSLRTLNRKGIFIPQHRPPPDNHSRELTRLRVMRLRARRLQVERQINDICQSIKTKSTSEPDPG